VRRHERGRDTALLLPEEVKGSHYLEDEMPFFNREESIHELLKHTERLYDYCTTEVSDKAFQFVSVTGAPGLGKVLCPLILCLSYVFKNTYIPFPDYFL
jgi:hypothetical protein